MPVLLLMKPYMKPLLAVLIVLATLCSSLGGTTIRNWSNPSPINWNEGVTVNNRSDGGFAITCPICSNHVNAIQANRPAIKMGQTIVLRFKIIKKDGSPNFFSLDKSPVPPGLLPNFRPMIQVDNDYYSEDKRWWPAGLQCAFLKANMTGDWHELRVKVKPGLWQNVFGKLATTRGGAFNSAISRSGQFNIVFGGGNSFSHGVCAKKGKVRIIVIVTVKN